jgi:hypothetical protein
MLPFAVVWIGSLHTFFDLDPQQRDAVAVEIVSHGEEPAETMRTVNPEWDFMARTFKVLALANRAIAKPEETDRNLVAIDALIDATIATERARGDEHFLLPYAKRGEFRDREARSLFIDGEIAVMIGARDRIAPREATRAEAKARAARIVRAMERSPTLSGESYPNECWTFCNTTALAGLVLLGRAGDLPSLWVGLAKDKLRDPKSGLLVSSYTYDGAVLDGPEGSSLWMTIGNLFLFDEALAQDQYRRARSELRGSLAGFGWAREWPGSIEKPDVDSGPIIPLLRASPGSSGLAFVGAAAAGDEAWLAELFASVELVGFRKGGRYRTSNGVGDAVIAYAISFGPLWKKVKS